MLAKRQNDISQRSSLRFGVLVLCRLVAVRLASQGGRPVADQVNFIETLLEPGELLRRMEIWCEEEIRAKRCPKGSW